jgi:hypothetical protein
VPTSGAGRALGSGAGRHAPARLRRLPDRRDDRAQRRHQRGELGLVELLGGVGLGLLGLGVGLDDDAVGARRGGGERQRRHQRPAPRGVGRVDPHRQVA